MVVFTSKYRWDLLRLCFHGLVCLQVSADQRNLVSSHSDYIKQFCSSQFPSISTILPVLQASLTPSMTFFLITVFLLFTKSIFTGFLYCCCNRIKGNFCGWLRISGRGAEVYGTYPLRRKTEKKALGKMLKKHLVQLKNCHILVHFVTIIPAFFKGRFNYSTWNLAT